MPTSRQRCDVPSELCCPAGAKLLLIYIKFRIRKIYKDGDVVFKMLRILWNQNLFIAVAFALIGAAVYTGITQRSQLSFRYDWAFSFAWAVTGMNYLAARSGKSRSGEKHGFRGNSPTNESRSC